MRRKVSDDPCISIDDALCIPLVKSRPCPELLVEGSGIGVDRREPALLIGITGKNGLVGLNGDIVGTVTSCSVTELQEFLTLCLATLVQINRHGKGCLPVLDLAVVPLAKPSEIALLVGLGV